VLPTDIIIDKGMGQTDGYSINEGITRGGRTYESFIKPVAYERVVVLMGGLATDYCVLNSALDTLNINPRQGSIELVVMPDAIRAVNLQPNDGRDAIAKMKAAGAHMIDSTDIINLIEFAR